MKHKTLWIFITIFVLLGSLLACTGLISGIGALAPVLIANFPGTTAAITTPPLGTPPVEPTSVNLEATQKITLTPLQPPAATEEILPAATTTGVEVILTGDISETVRIFQTNPVPVYDPFELAARLYGQKNLPVQLDLPPAQYQVGDLSVFWATDNDTSENYQIRGDLTSRN